MKMNEWIIYTSNYINTLYYVSVLAFIRDSYCPNIDAF